MLVRAFRLTDKFGNALLRVLIWTGESLLRQLYQVRVSLVNLVAALWFMLTHTLTSGRAVYETSAERRRAIMAHRAEERAMRTIVREDPLKSQNRSLSLFTVVLLALLIAIVFWSTSAVQNNRPASRPGDSALALMPTQATSTPTATPPPTVTPIPDPLRVGGSIVYAMRQNGRDNLWAVGIGQSAQAIRLTNTPEDDRDPAWSPDGSRIAFASHRGGNWDLYLMDVATGGITRLTFSPGYKAAPSWSPDGAYIAYEGYEGNNLDIYIVPSNGSGAPQHLTQNPAPDFSPAWSPLPGRRIAYVSLRDNNAEIYVIDLDRPVEDEALRLTNTSDVDEANPAWSPDGQTVAYSARANGIEFVYTKTLAHPEAEPQAIGQGRDPAWSPNGASLLYALDNNQATTFVGGLASGVGVSALAISTPGRASHPSWTAKLLPDTLVKSGGAPADDKPLYAENVPDKNPNPPFYQLRRLTDVKAPVAALSDRVDDSFTALRQATLTKTGSDFLGTLQDALWSRDRLPEPGQSRQSWQYAGRAFSFDRNLVFNNPPPIEVVREDVGVNTFWRVYIRVDEASQGGPLGEPLKQIPWDLASRTSGDPQVFEQGGRLKVAVPTGYYVDFTQLAEDYGWQRIPSERQWRSNFPSLLYWEFDRRDNLTWMEAMAELYAQAEIDAFLFGPTPVPTKPAEPTETPVPRRSPTPVPPDQGGQ